MQLRFSTGYTSTDYVTQEAWQEASLERCPLHPNGGCGFARHGTYGRVSPPGTRIARWYCPEGHQTFSLLPDCLAARLSGTLAEVEAVVDQLEQAPSAEAAVEELRVEIELPGVLRWLRRRAQAVHSSLNLLKGLMPERFSECQPTLASFRHALDVEGVLVALREIAADYLTWLPAPLGFRPPSPRGGELKNGSQHRAGPDPPSGGE